MRSRETEDTSQREFELSLTVPLAGHLGSTGGMKTFGPFGLCLLALKSLPYCLLSKGQVMAKLLNLMSGAEYSMRSRQWSHLIKGVETAMGPYIELLSVSVTMNEDPSQEHATEEIISNARQIAHKCTVFLLLLMACGELPLWDWQIIGLSLVNGEGW